MCRYGLVVGCAWCGDGNLNCWCDGNIETIRSKYQIMRRPLSSSSLTQEGGRARDSDSPPTSSMTMQVPEHGETDRTAASLHTRTFTFTNSSQFFLILHHHIHRFWVCQLMNSLESKQERII